MHCSLSAGLFVCRVMHCHEKKEKESIERENKREKRKGKGVNEGKIGLQGMRKRRELRISLRLMHYCQHYPQRPQNSWRIDLQPPFLVVV